MPSQFTETAPGGTVSGTRAVRRQSRGLIVEYGLEWTGDESVTVRLTDHVPTADVQEYGFHEDHAPAEWSTTDEELDLETALEPESERRLVLGLIADDVATDTFAEEPAVDVLETDGDGVSDDADHTAADGPDVDLAVDLEDEGAESGIEPGQRGQENGGPASADAPRGRHIDADGGVVNRNPETDGSVVSKLVAELEAGTVPESELSTLRAHLDDGSESEAVRLEYVQKRLSDFDAYVDALEDLISVHGSGDDAITDLDERLEALADEVATVRQRQDEMADRLEALSDSLDDQAEALESHRVAHEADVDDLRTEIRRRGEVLCEEFNDLQQSLDEDLAALEAEIEAFESIRRTLVDGLQRPDDLPSGTTVADADPGALEETEEIPIVDPGEARDAGHDGGDRDDAAVQFEATEDEPVLESGAVSDGVDDLDTSAGDETKVSVDLEESLERAEASNYSGSTNAPEDHAGQGESDADQDQDQDGRFDDEFVQPASDGPGGVADETDPDGSPEGPDEEGEEGAGDEAGDEFEVPGPDVDNGDEDAEIGDVEGVDTETDDAASEDAHDGDAGRDDGGDQDDGEEDSDGRATSIFEIGDVGSDGSGGDEKPTIDFEDS